MLHVTVPDNRVFVGERFSMSLQRTLRIPDDGREYPLPPGLGLFPVHTVAEFADRLPQAWLRQPNALLIPMRQREALWLGFGGADWKPNAVKIGIGGVNAISGDPWDEELRAEPQDYIVTPYQPWLDGINVGDGLIRQFVAVPLGSGYTVEGQLGGTEEIGGIQVLVFEPKPGRFPDEPPTAEPEEIEAPMMGMVSGMGFGVGGQMRQKIYPDPHGVDTWDPETSGSVFVNIVNSEQYRELTGLDPPPSPISTQTYNEYGLPWFDLYDEDRSTLAAADRLTAVRSIRAEDEARDQPVRPYDESIEISGSQVRKLRPGSSTGAERKPLPESEPEDQGPDAK